MSNQNTEHLYQYISDKGVQVGVTGGIHLRIQAGLTGSIAQGKAGEFTAADYNPNLKPIVKEYEPRDYFVDVATDPLIDHILKRITKVKVAPVDAPYDKDKVKARKPAGQGKPGSRASKVRDMLRAELANFDSEEAMQALLKTFLPFAMDLGFANEGAAKSCLKANIEKVWCQ